VTELERAITVVLESQRDAYVRLLNAYLALLVELAEARARLAVAEATTEDVGR